MTGQSKDKRLEIEQVILDLDNFARSLDSVRKDLEVSMTPCEPSSAEWVIEGWIEQWLEMINTICFYERLALFHFISMDDNCRRKQGYYSLSRVQNQKENIAEYVSRIQEGSKEVKNEKVLNLIEKAVQVIESILDVFDRSVQIYENHAGKEREGEFRGGARNGHGTYILPDGEIYIGQCKNGLPSGRGVVAYPDGSKYIGVVEIHTMTGQGTLILADSTIYEGEFKDDKMCGQGTLRLADGRKYVGEFKDKCI